MAEPRSRRSRHTDEATPGSAPISVQDLVERVDSERKTRRRRRAEPEPDEPTASGRVRRDPEPPATRRTPPPTPDAMGSGQIRRPPPEAGATNRTPGAESTGARRAVPADSTGARRAVPPETTGARQAVPAPEVTGSGRTAPADSTGARRAVPAVPPTAKAQRPAPGAKRNSAPELPAVGRRAAPFGPGGDPVTEELPVLAPAVAEPNLDEEPRAIPGVASPADYPTTALPKSVGAKPLSRLAANRSRRSKRIRMAGRSTATIVAVIALLITGVGWSYLKVKDNGFNQVTALDPNSTDIIDANAQYGDENFLIVGTDTRAGANGDLGAGTTEDAEGARADTVMLVNIPASRDRVVAVSFPRDLDVTRPVCEGWDNEKADYSAGTFQSAIGDKLNAVYALGGPRCLTKVIQKMTGLKVNHFVGIDFAGFETMVDTIGGVEVCTTKPLVDEVLGTILTESGKQMVNGSTALDYVRARHVVGDLRSDYDRINRQQRFLASLLRGALSNKVLFDLGKLNGFINAFAQHSFMDNVNTKDLLTLGRSLQKVDAGAITFLTIPTAGTTSYGNEIPRQSDIKALFQAVIDDQPLPGEKKPTTDDPTSTTQAPPTKPKLTAVDPNMVSLQVSNGSGMSGIAASAATKLSYQGFQIYSTGNFSEGTSTATTVRYSSGYEAAAATVASAIPGASLEETSGLGSIVEVVLGTNFSGTVTAPTDFGETLPDAPVSTSASATPVTLPSDLEHINAADATCE
ncbi:transcriptional regulator [Nocardia uniformis]|uniref:Transcriptional regulator n=1 Tax=Nocardia uniformis TaxID=53432 RepID=A0A849CGM9_9NOCA|nr:LCP family protein [Nocardia uniformis]NNH76085.1 transcriptional regulator [Nocardia uniformis]